MEPGRRCPVCPAKGDIPSSRWTGENAGFEKLELFTREFGLLVALNNSYIYATDIHASSRLDTERSRIGSASSRRTGGNTSLILAQAARLCNSEFKEQPKSQIQSVHCSKLNYSVILNETMPVIPNEVEGSPFFHSPSVFAANLRVTIVTMY